MSPKRKLGNVIATFGLRTRLYDMETGGHHILNAPGRRALWHGHGRLKSPPIGRSTADRLIIPAAHPKSLEVHTHRRIDDFARLPPDRAPRARRLLRHRQDSQPDHGAARGGPDGPPVR